MSEALRLGPLSWTDPPLLIHSRFAAQVGGDLVVYWLQIIMLLDSLIIFIIIIMRPIRAAKQRRSESRSRVASEAMNGGASEAMNGGASEAMNGGAGVMTTAAVTSTV